MEYQWEKWFYVEEPLVHWKEFAVLLTTHGVPIQYSVGGTMLMQGVGLQNHPWLFCSRRPMLRCQPFIVDFAAAAIP